MITIRHAQPEDITTFLDILSDAADWIHNKGIDQWPERFPADRIFPLITAGDAYLAEDDNGQPVACFALTPDADREFWTDEEEREPAFYLSKLARRRDAKAGLGATILRWCSDYTARHGIDWLRFDAWKTNDKLQEYYRSQGFQPVRTIDLSHRRSGALFQRRSERMPESVQEISEQLAQVTPLGELDVVSPPPGDPDEILRRNEGGTPYYDAAARIQALYEWADRPVRVTWVGGYTYRIVFRDDSWRLDYSKTGGQADDADATQDSRWKPGDPIVTTPASNGRDRFGDGTTDPWLSTADDERRPWTLRRDRTYLIAAGVIGAAGSAAVTVAEVCRVPGDG